MMNRKSMKMTAVALASFVTFGCAGLSASAAEASARPELTPVVASNDWHNSRRDRERQEAWERDHPRDMDYKSSHTRKTKSQGDVNTAYVVGAVVGAIIAKNT